jgi:hypothetical protein
MHRHRKLMPTFTERTIWGMGDGSDLETLDTPLGRLGGLICWEHQMTLAKYALYAMGEQVHCAQWPAYSGQNEHIGFGTRQYAFEGACFVISACGIVTKGSMPKDIQSEPFTANGGTSIVAPDGSVIAGPVYDSEEILYAEIDLEASIIEKHSRDVAGSYARPDVLQLVMNSSVKTPLVRGAEARALMQRATHGEAVDRLQTVRSYLGSLLDRIDSDADVDEAIAEALASIDMAASGIWSRE